MCECFSPAVISMSMRCQSEFLCECLLKAHIFDVFAVLVLYLLVLVRAISNCNFLPVSHSLTLLTCALGAIFKESKELTPVVAVGNKN